VREAFVSNYIAPIGPMVDAFEREFAQYTGIPYCLALSSGTAATHLALRHLMDRRTAARTSSSSTDNGQRTTDNSSPPPPVGDKSARRAATPYRPIVLASTLTFIGSVTPATFVGCELRFIDCDRESWNMDPLLLEAELAECARDGRQVLAVIPTDLYGQCCNLLAIKSVCDRHAVPVICDSAEAMGAGYRGEKSEVRGQGTGNRDRRSEIGDQRSEIRDQNAANAARALASLENTGAAHSGMAEGNAQGGDCGGRACRPRSADLPPAARSAPAPPTTDNGQRTTDKRRHAGFDAWAAVYSFNGNKIITTSGGGMLASHDKELIDHARKLATQARDPAPWYEHTEIGYNYRMSNVVAAIGRGQLQVLDGRVRRKHEIFAAYQSHFAGVPGISFMPEPEWSAANRWLTVVLIDPAEFGVDTHAVRDALERENIESRPVWKPMHLQPVFKDCAVRGGAVSEALFAQGLCLPSGTAMTDADIQRVAEFVLGLARIR